MNFFKKMFGGNRASEQPPSPLKPATPRTVAPPGVPSHAAPKRLISYQVANLQGVGSRERQEDSFAFVNAMDVTEIRRSGLLAVVADGMGGMRDGKAASETAIASLKADFQTMDRSGDLAAQLRDSVLRAGDRVFAALGGGGGSTVVACVFYDGRLYFASVGDSFLWLLRDGELLRLNREHNVLHERWLETVRAGDFDPEPARADREKAALSRFLGMDGLDGVDYPRRPLRIHDGDIFLLCSDGVGGALNDELVRACLESGPPSEMCAALERGVMLANNPYQDNFTALVVRCGY